MDFLKSQVLLLYFWSTCSLKCQKENAKSESVPFCILTPSALLHHNEVQNKFPWTVFSPHSEKQKYKMQIFQCI